MHNLLLAAMVLLMTAPVAMAQAPARNGAVWNGLDHQPTRAATADKERAAGIQPQAAARADSANTVDQIDRQLLDGTVKSPTGPVQQ